MLWGALLKFLTVKIAKILGNGFIDSQFNYAPLIWMFCKKTFYSKTENKTFYSKTLEVLYDAATKSQFIKGTFDF